MGQRMSALPTAELCGRAGEFDLGSGRAAACSTAFHALCAGKGADAALAKLTQEEREDLESWNKPEPFGYTIEGQSFTLFYSAADTELEVGLDDWGGYAEASSPDCISVGHLDMGWVVDATLAGKPIQVALVGDIKRSEWTSTPDSLQLLAYGLAYARKAGCRYFVPGIWAATEGTWSWGALVDVETIDWPRIHHAIMNVGGDFRTGPHCRSCYSRWRCPAHFLPPIAGEEEALAILTDRGSGQITADKMVRLRLLTDRLKDLCETTDKAVKDYAAQNPGVMTHEGKVYGPSWRKGRESCSAKSLREKMGEWAEPYISRGKDYEVFSWKKA